jgi:hypothetical protein
MTVPNHSADLGRERRRLFHQYVTGDGETTDWFNPPEEGQLVQVEWLGPDARLTWMVTKYPALNDGQADG